MMEQNSKPTLGFSLTELIGLVIINYLKKLVSTKQGRYRIGIVLDVACMALIIFNGIAPAKRILPPLLSSFNHFQTQAQLKIPTETFAFAPSLASNKFDYIDFNGLSTLAFFDVPVDADGSLMTSSRGYRAFKSADAVSLFDKAHSHDTRVVVTLSQIDNGEIQAILNSELSQQKLIDQAIAEVKDSGINGVAVDFEYVGSASKETQAKFTKFIKNFKNKLHQNIAQSQLNVVVPASFNWSNNLYDLHALSDASDKLLVMTDNLAVSEKTQNNQAAVPVYGYDQQNYWNDLSNTLNNFAKNAPLSKLSLERAWYGDGNNYPLYIPSAQPPKENYVQATAIKMDAQTMDKLVAGVPDPAKAAARRNVPYIAKALQDEGILNSNVLAYALATVEHETAGTFEPLAEYYGRLSARRLGYEGGTDYFGRGFIQLTHLRNYRIIGQRIGMGDQLAAHPDLASTPEVAAKVLAAFFKDNNIANLASAGEFIAARVPINPDRNGYQVAMLAYKYEGTND